MGTTEADATTVAVTSSMPHGDAYSTHGSMGVEANVADSASTDANDDVLIIAITVGAAIVVLAVASVVTFCIIQHKKTTKRHLGPIHAKNAGHTPKPLNSPSEKADNFLTDLNRLLLSDTNDWIVVSQIAELVRDYQHHLKNSNLDKVYDNPHELTRARLLLQEALTDATALEDAAVKNRNYQDAAQYAARIRILQAALPKKVPGYNATDDPSTEVIAPLNETVTPQPKNQVPHHLECVAPGLFLYKNRFEEDSRAFLGRGTSGAVSKGYFQPEGLSRQTVAVKELPRTASDTTAAMREFLIASEVLVPQHKNVVRIFTIKTTANMQYVVLEMCTFSMDQIPRLFGNYLYGYSQKSSSRRGKNTKRRMTAARGGEIVLQALIKDLLRGISFLHSKKITHCDIKPANVLCSFDRNGKSYPYRKRYFSMAQAKVTDFGASRLLQKNDVNQSLDSHGWASRSIVTLDQLRNDSTIRGSQAFMCPALLEVVRGIRKSRLSYKKSLEIVGPEMLLINDAFATGCTIGCICGEGKHPFDTGHRSIPANIIADRRRPMTKANFPKEVYVDLIEHLTSPLSINRWTVQQAIVQARIFGNGPGQNADATMLFDELRLRERPRGSCRDQLMSPAIRAASGGLLSKMLTDIEEAVARVKANEHKLLLKLDDNSYFALAAYTLDNGGPRPTNIYWSVNQALRCRKKDDTAFQTWKGFLFYLMRALDQLPKCRAHVFRGGNAGIDQKTVARHYQVGRPIQWAAFSSTSVKEEWTRSFVKQDEGVLFRIKVTSGRDIGPYSFIPSECEILLSPNTRFTVVRGIYKDENGYSCVDLVETQGNVLRD